MNTDNLRTFLQGDGIWILTAIAVLLAIKAWRNNSSLSLVSMPLLFRLRKDKIS